MSNVQAQLVAGVVPDHALLAMDVRREAARQRHAIGLRRGDGLTLVAELPDVGVVGYAEVGKARATGLPYDSEVYTLYVLPAIRARGTAGACSARPSRAWSGSARATIVWVLSENPARFFYSAIGRVTHCHPHRAALRRRPRAGGLWLGRPRGRAPADRRLEPEKLRTRDLLGVG